MLNTVFTTDIRHTLENFRRSVDQLFDNFYGFGYPAERPAPTATEGRPEWTFSPAVESWWTDDYLNLRAVIPGVSENDLKVSVQNNQQLVIEGERRAPEGFGRNAFTQLAYGRFYTAVNLPAGLDLDKLSCSLHNGVLDIRVPVTETMKPRQIPIQTEERKAISA